MKLKLLTALNTLALSLGMSDSAIAIDPATIYQRSAPAVVSISTPNGEGSGFIANPQGLIVTNQHVVGQNQQVRVRLADGSNYAGVVISRSPNVDLAIVQIRSNRRLPSLGFQRVPPKVGQRAYAIGNPRGLTRTLSDGIVSRIDPSGLIQYTAGTTFGSSGGPLLDEDGNVIGVVRSTHPGTNLSFAVPIAAVSFLPGQRRSPQAQQVSQLMLVSNLQIRQGNYDKALAILNRALEQHPNQVGLYLNRAVVHSYLKNYQNAAADYVRSIQLQPSSRAYLGQSRVYLALKQQQPSLKALNEAIRLNRNWGVMSLGEALYDRGRLQAQLGNRKAAIADFQQAARFYYQRGNVERYRSALDQITLINAQ